ncbi:TonB-dependent receptor [Parabacteroides faecis]|uniref:TonB-dependent receptor n=1 Tax=Parabacteroides faecis TaxID=1217282 RepID=UPI0021647FCF|nr:TonB-dependent receptor [Parabacteroides faecis]MCS2892102.1 TonB-dependent receptor [Parabacteroides faecis]UVQ49255.1 TonB-dependent receptor [Parabacteroides faecis]
MVTSFTRCRTPFLTWLFLFILFIPICTFAQTNRMVSGYIVDENNKALENIVIFIKGSELRTITDDNGYYSINLEDSKNHVLITNSYNTVSAVRDIPDGEQDYRLDIQLSYKSLSLPEVDITGAKPQSYNSDIAFSATRMEIPVLEIPGSVGIVTRKLIEDQQATTMTEVVRNLGGVKGGASGEAGNINEVFSSRGFSMTNSRNYFRNGVRYLKFSNDALSSIERIEILKGPASVLYGAVEPGGIINFITKPTLYTPRYGASIRYGSYDYKQAAIDLTGPINTKKTIRYRLNAMYEDADKFRKPQNSKRYDITPTIDIDLGRKTTLNLDADIFRDKRTHDPGVLHINNEIIDHGFKTFLGEPWAYGKFTNTSFGYELKHRFNKDWTFRSSARQYFTHEDRLYFQMKTPQKDSTITRRLAHWDAKINYLNLIEEISGNFTTGFIKHKAIAGVEFGRLTNRRKVKGNMYTPINYVNPVYSEKPTDFEMEQSTNLYITQNTGAIYLQDQLSFTDQLKLLIGARADWVNDKQDNYIKETKSDEKNFAISPRVGAVYMPIPSLSLYLSYSQSFVPQSGQTKDGKAFDPIRSKQWEAGIKKSFFNDRLTSSLAFYKLSKTNLPTTDPEDEEFKILIGEQTSKGIELAVSGEITPSWSVAFNYAYTHAEVTETNDKNYPVGTKLANISPSQLNLWTSYLVRGGVVKGLSFGGGWYYQGKSYGNMAQTIELDSYHIFDCFVAYKRSFYKISANLKNVFNQEYYTGSQGNNLLFPGTARTLMVMLAVNF